MTTPEITSPANPRIRAIVGLRDRRDRAARGLTLVDGIRELGRAVDAGVNVDEVLYDPGRLDRGRMEALVDRLAAARVRLTTVSPAVLDRVAFGERSEGLVGVVRIPSHGLADLDPAIHAADPLVTVVEGVEKPGNLGAVLRSVDGAGGSSLIAADPVTDLFNPNAIRASLGTIFAVPVAAGSSAAVLGWLRDRGIRILAARVDGGVEYTAADLTGPLAIVLGSEVAGLGAAWTDREISPIRLPMAGVADSLNVSIAAAVLLYEARRQREMRARA